MILLPTHTVPDPMNAPALRWGILGTGGIARAFATALHEGTRQIVQAVGSRSGQAAAFADEVGVRTAHESYDDLVADPEVDVVYVASPHSEHHDNARLALGADKPVLVEKAFTRNAAEAADLFAYADGRGLFCAEAMWSRFLPHYDVVRKATAEGVIGDLRSIVADHGQPLYPDGPRRLSDPALAGGSLLDLGVYPISFAQMLLDDPVLVSATGELTDAGVDAWVQARLAEGAATAECTSDMTRRLPTTATVTGNRGQLVIDSDFYQVSRVRLLDLDGNERDSFTPGDPEHGLRYEAAAVARCIDAGETQPSQMTHEDTLAVMRLMDAIRAEVGVVYPGEPA